MARKVRLHARDVEVLELLADRKVDTLDALHGRFWSHCARKSAYNRLGALAHAGYLTHVPRALPRTAPSWGGRPASQHLYLLGPKAPFALRLRGRSGAALVKRAASGVRDTMVDHQLMTNRVSDWLGTPLMDEVDAGQGQDRKHRPDGAYRAAADEQGRDLVLVEVDLGHYSRQRILDKAHGFLTHPEARAILFAAPTDRRADKLAEWIRDQYGTELMHRIEILSFDQLAGGAALPDGLEPVTPDPEADWYGRFIGRPGSR